MNDSTELHHIIIIGGGAGGLELATKLGNKLGKKGKAKIANNTSGTNFLIILRNC